MVPLRFRMYVEAVAAPLLATPIAFAIQSVIHKANISLLYLTAVLVVAVRTSTRPALVCAMTSFVAYNFFFTEPKLTLLMIHDEDVLTVTFFLIIAAITGQLAARLRNQLTALRTRDEISRSQFRLSERLTTAIDQAQVLDALCETLRDTVASRCRVRLIESDAGTIESGSDLDPVNRRAAQAAADNAQPAGLSTDVYPEATSLFLPVHDDRRCVALIETDLRRNTMDPLQQRTFALALVKQAGLALGRTRLTTDLQKERVEKEREILRSALLSSVSHDLRSPLAAMIGATTSLRDLDASLTREQKRELMESVLEESQRLDRYIQNLLDMTRLGHGELKLERDWIDLRDIVSVTMRRIRPLLEDRSLDIRFEEDLPLLYVHGALIEQALFNLVDNAIKFSPDGSEITIAAKPLEGAVELDVIDQGAGIAPEDRERVFKMFHSAEQGDRQGGGTGLGLAIAHGIIAAHAGTISALPGEGNRGTTMHITLPTGEKPPIPEDDEE